MNEKSSVISPDKIITDDFLRELFPEWKADQFFEALYGGCEEGAFDICLACREFAAAAGELALEFRLTERPGKCLACSLTYGLPPVFQRHPVINLKGIIHAIEEKLSPCWELKKWSLGQTRTASPKLSTIPLILTLEKK
ncbi:MAG TPA: pancreas/duodenum homeobox protein 1 [Thermodesulfobacteriaceae bacterium]|nr:pancreas/duodenum homeobox protein 1 [Thermodesulfobacteriaceae bacterium]